MFSTEGISLKESMMASRQKSIESHIIYEGPDVEAHAKLYQVLMDIADMDKANILPQDNKTARNKNENDSHSFH